MTHCSFPEGKIAEESTYGATAELRAGDFGFRSGAFGRVTACSGTPEGGTRFVPWVVRYTPHALHRGNWPPARLQVGVSAAACLA